MLQRSPNRPSTLYVNDPNPKSNVSTLFHSPFANGKPRPGYTNPTFLSSTLFYPDLDQAQTKARLSTQPSSRDFLRWNLMQRTLNESKHLYTHSPVKNLNKDEQIYGESWKKGYQNLNRRQQVRSENKSPRRRQQDFKDIVIQNIRRQVNTFADLKTKRSSSQCLKEMPCYMEKGDNIHLISEQRKRDLLNHLQLHLKSKDELKEAARKSKEQERQQSLYVQGLHEQQLRQQIAKKNEGSRLLSQILDRQLSNKLRS